MSSGLSSIVTSIEISQTYLNHHEAIGKIHDQAVELHDAEMKYIYEIVTEARILWFESRSSRIVFACVPEIYGCEIF